MCSRCILRLDLTSYLSCEFYGHDWLQTYRYKTRALWGLFAEVSEKSVLGFWNYWHFFKKCGFKHTPLSQMFLYLKEDKRMSIYQTHFVFVPLFSKHTLTRQIIILSTKNSQEFLASKVSVLRRNKATNSSTSNRPFFSCTESPLVLGNLFKIFRLDITFAREVCHLGIKMKKI